MGDERKRRGAREEKWELVGRPSADERLSEGTLQPKQSRRRGVATHRAARAGLSRQSARSPATARQTDGKLPLTPIHRTKSRPKSHTEHFTPDTCQTGVTGYLDALQGYLPCDKLKLQTRRLPQGMAQLWDGSMPQAGRRTQSRKEGTAKTQELAWCRTDDGTARKERNGVASDSLSRHKRSSTAQRGRGEDRERPLAGGAAI